MVDYRAGAGATNLTSWSRSWDKMERLHNTANETAVMPDLNHLKGSGSSLSYFWETDSDTAWLWHGYKFFFFHDKILPVPYISLHFFFFSLFWKVVALNLGTYLAGIRNLPRQCEVKCTISSLYWYRSQYSIAQWNLSPPKGVASAVRCCSHISTSF